MDKNTLERLIEQHQQRLEQRLLAEAKAASITYPERKGWQEKGLYFTCKPHAAHPWNPAIVKAIWAFDPRIVPCWVNWVFEAPPEDASGGEEVVFGRHVLALHVDDPKAELDDFPCEMPTMPCQGISFKKPNRLVAVLMQPNTESDLPGAYIEFDWPIVEWLKARSIRDQSSKEVAADYINDRLTAYNRLKSQLSDERAYRQRDLQRFVDKKLATVSETEIKEYLLRRRDTGNFERKKKLIIT